MMKLLLFFLGHFTQNKNENLNSLSWSMTSKVPYNAITREIKIVKRISNRNHFLQ